jgi:ATP-dependent DNA ligase
MSPIDGGTDFSYRFPAIADAVCGLSADQALIDGEAVALRKDGRSAFYGHAAGGSLAHRLRPSAPRWR